MRQTISAKPAWRSGALLVFLFCLTPVHGQTTFDYKRDFQSLLDLSRDSTSNLYYPTLLERFNRNDGALTDREMLALQIGFTRLPAYKPYETIDTEREIQQLIGAKDYAAALVMCNTLLRTNPMNLTALMEKSFSYIKLGKDSTEFHRGKVMKVIRSVVNSGSGTMEAPYFVLSPLDGQTLITHVFGASIGSMGSGSDPNGYFLDMLEIVEEGKESRTLCFNIDHATKKMFSEEDMKRIEDAVRSGEEKK